MNKKSLVTQLLRHAVQIAAFLLLPGLFLSVFNALRDIVMALIAGNFSFSMLSGSVFLLFVILAVTVFWGRFFCGYLCAFGSVQELFAFISAFIFRRRKKMPGQADRVLKFVKYAVLVLIVLFIWVLQLPVDSSFSPWGVFGMLVSGSPAVMRSAIPTIGFVLLLAILAASFFVERFFCRYLCPLGALFTLISAKRLFHIHRARSRCTGCSVCTRKCAMGLDVSKIDTVYVGECIDCMRCLGVCKPEALKANAYPALAGTASALMIGGLVTVGNIATSYTDSLRRSSAAVREAETVSEKYSEEIPETETALVPEETTAPAATTILEETSVPEATTVPEATEEALPEEELQAEEITEEIPAEEPQLEEETPDEIPAEEVSEESVITCAFTDGEYTGSGSGFRGTTTVSVTVADGIIADITVLSTDDDYQFFVKAESYMIENILVSQGIDVPAVSGATFSSNGILEAVADALGLDYSNPNSTMSRHGH